MRKLMLLPLAALAIAGTGYLIQQSNDEAYAAPIVEDLRPGYGPTNFATALASARDDVSHARSRLADGPDEWLRREMLALALMSEFRLSGDIGSLREARELLESGTAQAPEPSGPNLSSAALALSMHQLDRSASALDRFDFAAPRRNANDRAEAAAMRGDIAFQQGNLAAARASYEKADQLNGGLGSAMRLSNVMLWSGNAEQARREAEAAVKGAQLVPQNFARVALAMANLSYAQGDFERAGEWVAAAQDRFEGFWLVEAYAAQQRGAAGDMAGGIADLEALANRTGEPEVIDTLVGFLQHDGQDRRAAEWTRKAQAGWLKKLDEDRAAYRLHAAEHYLDFGDPAEALVLAREDFEKRPFGEVAEVYASAMIATGDVRGGLALLEQIDEAGWRAVSLDLARAEALTALGRADEAAEFVERARKINPDATEPMRKLVRFGHY